MSKLTVTPALPTNGHAHDYDVNGRNPREAARVRQALNDAAACRESRRVSRANNRCDCYCCTLDRSLYHGKS